MKLFIKHCLDRKNLMRAVKVALIVGTILAAINHFDMFLSGDFVTIRIYQILISYLVPFSVSLYSSAMTGRHHEKKSFLGMFNKFIDIK